MANEELTLAKRQEIRERLKALRKKKVLDIEPATIDYDKIAEDEAKAKAIAIY